MNSATINQLMRSCNLCHRHCHVDRNHMTGYCRQTANLRAARAALHFWEEPCLSGTKGSGTVFFSGCCLCCVFCQNHEIAMDSANPDMPSAPGTGKEITIERLAEIFLELQEKGAHNINLVTPSHFIPQIVSALILSKNQGLILPVVYNTGSYETVEALKMLDGLVDIYLPDLKYCSSELSARYSNTPDYFSCACKAIEEMFRQAGEPKFLSDGSSDLSELSEHSLLQKGVIVRHLLLPGCLEDSKKVLTYLYQTYGDSVFISIMSQYTPMKHLFSGTDMTHVSHLNQYPELTRRVTKTEYDALTDFALSLGIENAFIQEMDVAEESFIPSFRFEGL